MADLNSISLIGRLTKDPEIIHKGDTTIARFSIAQMQGFGKNKFTQFVNCVAFGSSASFCGQYLKKGMQIGLSGMLEIKKYESKDYTTIIVKEITPIFSQKDREEVVPIEQALKNAELTEPAKGYDDEDPPF